MNNGISLTEEHAPYNTELNGKTGVFIETHNIEESTTLIQQLLNNQVIIEKVREFRDEVHDSWTWVDIQLQLDIILKTTIHSERLRGNEK